MKALILSTFDSVFYYHGRAVFTCRKNHTVIEFYMRVEQIQRRLFQYFERTIASTEANDTSYESPNTELFAVIEIIFCDLATFMYLDCIMSVPIMP